MNRFRWTVRSGVWYWLEGQLDGGNATDAATPTDGDVYYVPFYGRAGLVIDQLAYEVTTQGVSASGTDRMRFGIYLPHATTGLPDALLVDFGDVDLEASAPAVLTFDVANTALDSAVYWMAVVRQTTGTVGTPAAVRRIVAAADVIQLVAYETGTPIIGTAATIGRYPTSTGVTGALPATATIASFGTGRVAVVRYKAA